jgi:hypothetical protein
VRQPRHLVGLAALLTTVACGSGDADEASADTPLADGGLSSGPDAGKPSPDAGTKESGAGPNDAGAASETDAPVRADADSVWQTLNAMAVESPLDHGAVGDGVADDLAALGATVAALPAAGGIVFLPAGKRFCKNDLLIVTKAHVKFWAPNRQAEIFGSVQGQRRKQSTICRNTSWCGFFGLRLTSDATARFDALEDNQISTDNATDVEIDGCDIEGSAATGLFFYGASRRLFVEGNYVHLTWADHIHHTDGTRESFCWDNTFYNTAPSLGDDGIACVTYGATSPRCGQMEWWNNTHLGSGNGRGYAVIGGDQISIHHNWAIRTAGAGIIVASEPSYSSATSDQITIHDNWLDQCSQTIGHPGILISGLYAAAGPITNVHLTTNVVAETKTGQAYRTEGDFSGVTNDGLSTDVATLPQPQPTTASVRIKDTAILKTRDTAFVPEASRPGLYRIHVRVAPVGGGLQQRFEYVVKGAPSELQTWLAARSGAGDYVSEQRTVTGTGYALVLARAPEALPSTLSGVTFQELRDGDNAGTLSWLWSRVNDGSY